MLFAQKHWSRHAPHDCNLCNACDQAISYAGTGQALVAASVTQRMLGEQPHKHVVYLTDRVHLLYQQAAVFTSALGFPVGR